MRTLGVGDHGTCATAICLAAIIMAAASPVTALAQSLPPPQSIDPAAPMAYHLELVVNRRLTGRVVPVVRREGDFLLARSDLVAIGIDPVQLPNDPVNVTRMDGFAVEYDGPAQRLSIRVPPDWLPRQSLNEGRYGNFHEARASKGVLLNYDLFASDSRQGHSTATLGHEIRLFDGNSRLFTNGVYRHTLSGEDSDDGYRRLDTRYEYTDQDRLMNLEVGDVITRPLGWSNAVRLGGIQVSREFSLRPDLVTYPVPEFSGETAVPTTLDLFIDGARRSSIDVDPGPFTLTDMPVVSGAGEATVVTTDVQGRRVATTLPFYISNDLLKPGFTSYSAAIGALRRQSQDRDFDYDEAAASASYRRGINDWFTLELQGEVGESVAAGGVGGVFGLGRAGTFDASIRHGDGQDGDGNAYTAGYEYHSRRFSLGLRRRIQEAGFVDLARDSFGIDDPMREQTTQLTAGINLGTLGSLSGGYFSVDRADEDPSRVVSLSYSRSLFNRANLSLRANRQDDDEWSVLALFTFSLREAPGSANAGVRRDADDDTATRLGYGRSAPLAGGWGWNVAYETRQADDDYRQADVTWRGDSVELRGGLYGSGDDDVRFAQARGSVVGMDREWFAANRVRDAFVVVDTDGYEGIPVRYENQLVGHTRTSGHLLVPWAADYYAGKYEIDPLVLPAHLKTPTVEQRVAVHSGSGYLLRFPVERIVAASITLLDDTGKPLPLGSQVVANNVQNALVGWDGMTYFEKLTANNRLHVTLPDGGECRVSFELDIDVEGIHQIAPLTCE